MLSYIPLTGVPVTVNSKPKAIKTVRCILCGTFDAPAKCLFQYMVQLNGSYGCPYCLHQGETVKTSERGHTRTYPFLLKDPQVAEEHCKGQTTMLF